MHSAYYSMYSGPAGQAQDVCQRVHDPRMSAAEKLDQARRGVDNKGLVVRQILPPDRR